MVSVQHGTEQNASAELMDVCRQRGCIQRAVSTPCLIYFSLVARLESAPPSDLCAARASSLPPAAIAGP